MQGTGRRAEVKQTIAKPVVRGPEYNPWFWNPARGSSRRAPSSFLQRLHDLSPSLEVVWNPILERWAVWDRAPRINHPVCQGWRLLFIHWDTDHSYLPLDERLFARLYAASADAHGNAKEYFARIVREMERDKERTEKANLADTIDAAMEHFQHSQISVSGAGKSSGSKFSTYHQ